MPLNHEYAVLGGLNRATIGRTLSLVAAILSSGLVAAMIAVINLLKWLGYPLQFPQVIMVPITGGVIYAVLYWLFKSRIWKMPRLSTFLKVPNLSGNWRCEGMTLNPKGGGEPTAWEGEIVIEQDWDMLRVRLKTKTSGSNSIAAALTYDSIDGYRLLYNYINDPRVDAPKDMRAHRGSADLVFTKDLQSAEGDYFNGHDRYTYGTMKLKKVEAAK